MTVYIVEYLDWEKGGGYSPKIVWTDYERLFTNKSTAISHARGISREMSRTMKQYTRGTERRARVIEKKYEDLPKWRRYPITKY